MNFITSLVLNNKYYYNNRNGNALLNYKNNKTDYNNNNITDYNKVDLYPNLNKSSINLYNNNKLSRRLYDNDMKNKKKNFSMEYEYNDNCLLKNNFSNFNNNNNKISQTKKTKIILRNKNQNPGINLFYNYDNNIGLNKIRDNYCKKKEVNNNLCNYSGEYIKDIYMNKDYYNNT